MARSSGVLPVLFFAPPLAPDASSSSTYHKTACNTSTSMILIIIYMIYISIIYDHCCHIYIIYDHCCHGMYMHDLNMLMRISTQSASAKSVLCVTMWIAKLPAQSEASCIQYHLCQRVKP